LTTCNMDMGLKLGIKAVLSIQDSSIRARRTVEEGLNGKMGRTMKATLLMDSFRGMESTTLQT
jgi:hypothetical protein